jgi:hypothetical protein
MPATPAHLIGVRYEDLQKATPEEIRAALAPTGQKLEVWGPNLRTTSEQIHVHAAGCADIKAIDKTAGGAAGDSRAG